MVADTISETAERIVTVIRVVDTDLIDPNPWQPRRTVDRAGIAELAEDIDRNGLLQPILVRLIAGGVRFQLVFGQRRLMAVRWLIEQGRWTDGIRAQIGKMDDRQVFLAAIAENSARESVDPVEESKALSRALDGIRGLTQQDLAESLGVSKGQISNRLRLLRLPDEVLELVSAGRLSWTSAREFLCLVGSDHRHDAEIALAVKRLTTRYEGDEGAYPVSAVRDEITSTCAARPNTWKPLEETRNHPVPNFDVDVFKECHKGRTHRLPKRWDSGSVIWTCRAQAWMAEYSRVQEALGVSGEPMTKWGQGLLNGWQQAMLKDPVVQKHAPGFSAENPEFTAEELKALGPRAKYVKNPGVELDFSHDVQGDRWYSAPPEYFDATECITSCTKGAYWDVRYHETVLTCSNQPCFQQKLDEGRDRFQAELDSRIDAGDRRHQRLREALRPVLANSEFARALARWIVANTWSNAEDPLDHYHEHAQSLRYYPPAWVRAAGAMGIEPEDPVEIRGATAWDRDDALECLESHDDPAAVAVELASIAFDEVCAAGLADLIAAAEPAVAPAPPGTACAHVNTYQVSRKARVRTASGRSDSRYVPDGRRCRDCGDLVDRGQDRQE